MESPPPLKRLGHTAATVAGGIGLALGIGYLAAWYAGADFLRLRTPELAWMHFSAAWFTALSGGAILIRMKAPRLRWAAHLCAAGVLFVAINLLATQFDLDWPIAFYRWLPAYAEPVVKYPPSALTSIAMLVFGLALAAFDKEWRGSRPAEHLAILSLVIALAVLNAYAHGILEIFSHAAVASTWGMGLTTAIAIAILSAGIILARPERGLAARILSPEAGGVLARTLIPAVILLPIFLGLAIEAVEDLGVFGHINHGSVFAALGTALAAVVVLRAAALLNAEGTQRRRAVAALQASESRLWTVIEAAPDAIVTVDPKGRVLSTNARAEALFAMSRDAMVGLSIDSLVPGALAALTSKAAGGEGRALEAQARRADGREVPVEVRGSELDGRAAFLAVIRDVAARYSAEEERAHLANIVESSDDAIIAIGDGGAVLSWNPGAERIYGYPTQEVLGRVDMLPKVLPPGREEEMQRVLFRVLRGDRVDPFETERVRKDGTRFAAAMSVSGLRDRHGRVHGYSVIARDVTARKRAEEERLELLARERRAHAAVEAERARLVAVLENAPNGILFQAADGGPVLANRALEALFGPVTSWESLPTARMRRPDGKPLTDDACPLGRALAGQLVSGAEFLIDSAEGRPVPVVVNAAPVRGPGGAVLGAVLTVEDVSHRKELERFREEYVFLISHDLRNPLNAMKLQAHLVGRAFQKAGVADEHGLVKQIQTSVDRMDRMIQELLEISKLESGRIELARERTDLGQLVADAVERAVPPDQRERFRLELPPEPVIAPVDRPRIERVIANFASNALKYSEPGTEVRVRVERNRAATTVSVRDHGDGLGPEELSRVFEKYFRAAKHQKGQEGFGLGLYISRLIIEAHGGRVVADSEPGHGSTFSFTLPAPETPPPSL